MNAAPTSPSTTRPTTGDVDELRADLEGAVDGEVRFDEGSLGAYSTDGSNYRQVPIGVVLPRTVDASAEAVRVCRDHDVPLLSRGGGTSLGGQCCNTAVVLDWSKYCDRLVSVDPASRRAVVEPGIVLDALNAQLAPYGLMVGPKPSTHFACTIGGMIGNNSCGSTAQRFGKMADSVERLEILTYDGVRAWVGATSDEEYERILAEGGRLAEIYRSLRALRDTYLAEIRQGFPKIPRRVSGYNLDHLLPEKGFHVARALVGSEGTLATVLRAEIALVEVPKARTLVVLGYRDVFAAADAVPEVAKHDPLALEGLDDRLIELERREHLAGKALDQLPEGAGWLMVQFGADTEDEVDASAQRLLDRIGRGKQSPTVAYVDDPVREDALWEVRESGLGATAFPPIGHRTHEGLEDAAVPPERLGEYLRDFRDLLVRYDYESASLYGHFGHGCVHTRIPFHLKSADGIARFRSFVTDAAELVVGYGGSLSGEHGDGQARAELLPKMFGAELIRAFSQLKGILDPSNRMNPGKVAAPEGMAPYRLDENLRLGTDYDPPQPRTHFGFPHDSFQFSHAAARCVGVGKCRSHSGGVMCPSYRVTREEEHSTRGRARLLFEMMNGEEISDGWRSTAVRDALDLCLACKGCRSDCPVNVDMATYKAEFLSHHYAGRLRPSAHYSMGWLPLWARIAATAPGAVNALVRAPAIGGLAKAAGGIAQQREVPLFAQQRFTDWMRRRGSYGDGPNGVSRGEVLLWPDTFTNNLQPAIARAATRVLENAGFRVRVPQRTLCCGLTWISTGQLATAKRVIRRTVADLRDDLRAGVPIVGLEPSCTAVFRADAPELFPGDEDVDRLARQTYTLAELLIERAPAWRPTRGVGRAAVAQPHCHQHAIMGYDADKRLAERAGLDLEKLDVGCCGVAGNFGFESGHYDVSVGCARQGLWQAVEDAGPDTLVLADGFSCRTQIEHGGSGRRALHLAEVLAAALRGRTLDRHTEAQVGVRPAEPSPAARWGAAGAAAGAALLPALTAGLVRSFRRR